MPVFAPGRLRSPCPAPGGFSPRSPSGWRFVVILGSVLRCLAPQPPPPSEDLLQVRDFLYRTILCSLSHFSALNTELGMAGGHLSWNQALEGRNLVNSPGSPEARVRRHCCREPPTSPTTQDVLCSSLPWVKGGLLQCSALCPLPDQV